MSDESKPWAQRVTLVVAILGGLLSSIALGDRALQWLSPSLIATATFTEFAIPPRHSSGLGWDSMTVRLTPKAMRIDPSIGNASKTEPAIAALKAELANNIGLYAEHFRDLTGAYGTLNGMWTFSIENRGSEKLSAITLRIPESAIVSLALEGAVVRDTVVNEVIMVGDLQPSATAKLRVWTRGYFGYLDTDRIRLVHDRGKGSVQFLKPVGSLGQLAHWFTQPFAIILLLTSTTALVLSITSSDTKKTQGASASKSSIENSTSNADGT